MANITYENIQKDSVITTQEDKIHTAFYIIDSKKSLKYKGILESDGGFIGIGSNKKVKLNDREFTEIDIREVLEFSLNNAKKVQLITDHPEGSYDLIQEGISPFTDEKLLKNMMQAIRGSFIFKQIAR